MREERSPSSSRRSARLRQVDRRSHGRHALRDRDPAGSPRRQKDVALVWDYEVANVQDRSITVGRIVKGLSFFLLGLFASRGS